MRKAEANYWGAWCSCGPGGGGGGSPTQRVLCGSLVGRCCFLWLVPRWKRGQNLGPLGAIGQALAIGTSCYRVVVSFLDGHWGCPPAACKSDSRRPASWAGLRGRLLGRWSELVFTVLWSLSFVQSVSQGHVFRAVCSIRTGPPSPSGQGHVLGFGPPQGSWFNPRIFLRREITVKL